MGPPTIIDDDGVVELAWDPPTTREDGSALSNLAGIRLYMDTDSPVDGSGGTESDLGNVDSTVLTFTSGSHPIAVRAYDSEGFVSDFSNEVIILVP